MQPLLPRFAEDPPARPNQPPRRPLRERTLAERIAGGTRVAPPREPSTRTLMRQVDGSALRRAFG